MYPTNRWWADYFIYFYNHNVVDGMGHHPTVCILDVRTDEIVEDYRVENEDKSLERSSSGV
jgi:hypothetical protein